MQMLSFRQFIEITQVDEPPSLYQAATDELNTLGQVPVQIFSWVNFGDHYRFGQAFKVVGGDDKDKDGVEQDDAIIWIQPVTGKERGDEKATDNPGSLKLNVMKCAKKDPTTGKMIQIQCSPLSDTKKFPISRQEWRKMVNAPFKQMAAATAPGSLPGM